MVANMAQASSYVKASFPEKRRLRRIPNEGLSELKLREIAAAKPRNGARAGPSMGKALPSHCVTGANLTELKSTLDISRAGCRLQWRLSTEAGTGSGLAGSARGRPLGDLD